MNDEPILIVPLAQMFAPDGDLQPLFTLRLQVALNWLKESLSEGLPWDLDLSEQIACQTDLTAAVILHTESFLLNCAERLRKCRKDLRWLKETRAAATTKAGKQIRTEIREFQRQVMREKKHHLQALPLLREYLTLLRHAQAITRGDRS